MAVAGHTAPVRHPRDHTDRGVTRWTAGRHTRHTTCDRWAWLSPAETRAVTGVTPTREPVTPALHPPKTGVQRGMADPVTRLAAELIDRTHHDRHVRYVDYRRDHGDLRKRRPNRHPSRPVHALGALLSTCAACYTGAHWTADQRSRWPGGITAARGRWCRGRLTREPGWIMIP